jgi:hypothetical protein
LIFCRVSNASATRKSLSSRGAHVLAFTLLAQASSLQVIPIRHIPAAHQFNRRQSPRTMPGADRKMEPSRDQLFGSSLSDVPIGPSEARDDSTADAPDEIAALEQRARDSLAVLQAHLGSLTLPDIGSDPYTRSSEWRPFDRNDYIRLVRREARPTHGLTQALASGGSWLLSGLAIAPLGLLLVGFEPGGRVEDPVLLEAVHIFDEPAAAFLGSIAAAGEATRTAAPALAAPLALRAAEPDDRSAIEGAGPEAAASVAFAAPVARAADESHPTVAPAFGGAPVARAVPPRSTSSIEMARPEPAALPAFAGHVASAAHSHATMAPAMTGSIAAQLIRPARLSSVESGRPQPVVSRAVAAPVARAAGESHSPVRSEITALHSRTAIASARVEPEPARSLASPGRKATVVDAAAPTITPMLAGSMTARPAELDRPNRTEGAPAVPPVLVSVAALAASREESRPGAALALASPGAAQAVEPDRTTALESARPEPAVAGASTRAVAALVADSHPTVTPARVGLAAARAIPPAGESWVERGQPKLAVSPDFPKARNAARESHPVLRAKLEQPIALIAERTVSPLSPMASVGGQATAAKPRMDAAAAVSDVVVLPVLASLDGPIGDHERLIAIASRAGDPVAGVAPVAEEPKLTSAPDVARDPAHDLKLAARSGPMRDVDTEPARSTDEEPAGTPVSLRADLTLPRLLAEEVALPPELVLSQGETAIRLASGVSSAFLQPGIYEAVIEWGGAQLPIAPLIVGNEPVEIAFRIEPSTVTLRFDGVVDERVLWTIRRSEGGTLRLRGPVVSASLPPGDYTIEAEVDGELHRHPLKVGVGEALTIVAR